ncbi:unnamed protein product, partial [Rotaria socialis]
MIRSASHGVAKICDSCTYSSDDCIANAMSIVICTTDSAQCEIFARKKRLSECNDKYNDNVHIEYDCVPISMADGKKEYTICQNSTDITSDYGIIRSPGYSRQFQITATIVECFRSINVPSNKAIRLWLTDRYIGSTPEDCTQGHVDVVDSIRTRVANYKSCTIQCPDNYGIVITKNIFGVTQFNKCEVHEADKHCTTTIATALSCHQNCSFFYSGNQLVAPC